ncbi:hypothetical protein VTH06DRAFT_841 [Thermothelomyces fergusii]
MNRQGWQARAYHESVLPDRAAKLGHSNPASGLGSFHDGAGGSGAASKSLNPESLIREGHPASLHRS